MVATTHFQQIKDLLSTAQTILVLLEPEASLDQVAAATALSLALQAENKEVTLAAPLQPTLPPTQAQNLAGLDLIQTEINNQNLLVSFDYVASAVEKVSYHIGEETQRFYLTVAPQRGQPPLNKDSIEVGYVGATADLVFLVGVHDFEDLGHLYLGNEQLFNNAPVVTLNTFAAEIGTLRLDFSEKLNLSAGVADLLNQLGLEVGSEAATNLLLALEDRSQHFGSLSVTPELLETAAWLMRQGARRIRTGSGVESKSQPQSQVKKIKKAQVVQSVAANKAKRPVA